MRDRRQLQHHRDQRHRRHRERDADTGRNQRPLFPGRLEQRHPISVDLSLGTDTLMILGTPAANTITLGARGLHLESDATANVTETNVEGITVEGAGAADTISGAGDGTTGPPIVVPLTLRGLSDADSL